VRRHLKWVVTLGFFLQSGCATLSEVTPAERMAMQTQVFENTSYENVFQSFKTVLQDDGYLIKNQDQGGGFIVASVDKNDKASSFFAAINGSPQYRSGDGFELSINLERVTNTTIRARTTIQRVERYSLGSQEGEEVLEPTIYRNFYDMVRVEVAHRGALGSNLEGKGIR